MSVPEPSAGQAFLEPQTSSLPFAGDGRWHVGASRVSFDSVVSAFNEGETPEGIVDRFPSLDLADVYQAIAYFLKNPRDVQLYLAAQETSAEEFRQRSERQFGSSADLRARLLARRSHEHPEVRG